MAKRSTGAGDDMSMRKAESLAIGSPLVVRLVGAILCAIALWIGNSVYSLNNKQVEFNAQLNNQTKIIDALTIKVDDVIKHQYTKTQADKEIGEIRLEIQRLEIRIREMENSNSQSGGPNDPIFIIISTLKDKVSGLETQLATLTQEIKNLGQGKK